MKLIVTQEDLDNNPDLVTAGVKVGEEIEIPEPASTTDSPDVIGDGTRPVKGPK